MVLKVIWGRLGCEGQKILVLEVTWRRLGCECQNILVIGLPQVEKITENLISNKKSKSDIRKEKGKYKKLIMSSKIRDARNNLRELKMKKDNMVNKMTSY